ncbi:hypothetical protein ACS0TY_018965 [Phlomoides rotata]
MGILELQIHLSILVIILASPSKLSATTSPIAKLNCNDYCGDVRIPFPFGISEDCYLNSNFSVHCDQSSDPHRAFYSSSTIQITNISLDGQLTVLNHVAYDCYRQNQPHLNNDKNTWIYFSNFTINSTANRFTVVGCDTYAYVYGRRRSGGDRFYQTGCTAMCGAKGDLENGPCEGSGCCKTFIPKHIRRVEVNLRSFQNYTNVSDFNDCGYAFVAEEGAFTFSPDSITNLENVKRLPMVIDWDIGNVTDCDVAKDSSSYACKSEDSECYMNDNGYGYRCFCKAGYQGNPYLVDGCQDIDECQDLTNNCEENHCNNTQGSFKCFCPKGYVGDGEKEGKGCRRGESLVFKIAAGVSLGVVVLLLSACWLNLELKRRMHVQTRQQFFLQNGGLLLQEKLIARQRQGSLNTVRIFSASELRKATNNFHNSKIIGQGGHGTVYKGVLPDDNKVVAIKKSKKVDSNEIDQFVNEVIVLSQINHRNVVKLLGCCMETEAPLLVYEFINNATLSEHIHNKATGLALSWDMRLRIATETAGVLSYLHSAASTPIIHRDVKTANILLDHTYTAKVADFGASRLVPPDDSQLIIFVQGTIGYLDPEYLQSMQLNEKSDVYRFGVVLMELLTGRKALIKDGPDS